MKNWRDAIVGPEESVRAVMRAIDKAALKTAFVCDDNQVLLGIATDGDIRRGLIEDLELDHPIKSVMNVRPKISNQMLSRKSKIAELENNQLDLLPVVNEQNQLVAIDTLLGLRAPMKQTNPVFIMAGGFGTRLRPLTDHCPKPMLPVGNKPLLEHLIKRFIAQGFSDFFVSTHYLPQQIVDYFGDGSALGVSIKYVHEDMPLGTGGALSLLPANAVSAPVILINGDLLTDLDFEELVQFHISSKVDATMCLRQQETSIAYGVVETDGRLVSRMIEKPTYHHLINTGIYVLSPDLIDASNSPRKIDLPTLLEERMALGHKVGAYRFYGRWLDIGKMSDYNKAHEFAEECYGPD